MEKGQKGMKWRWGGWLGEHGKFESGEGRNRGSKGDAPNISDRTASCIHLCKWGGEAAKDLLSRHPEQPMGVGGGDHPWAGPRNSENPITLPPSEYGT